MLSSTGRIGRGPFLLGASVLMAAGVAFRQLAGPQVHRYGAFIVYGALLFSAACLLSKRLHDRGRAGWWAFFVVFALIALWPLVWSPGQIVWIAVLAWALVDLGLMPGRSGANRFGPPPGSTRTLIER
jgi:uncharacterized membrane protein YhaH (DUF805 family)